MNDDLKAAIYATEKAFTELRRAAISAQAEEIKRRQQGGALDARMPLLISAEQLAGSAQWADLFKGLRAAFPTETNDE